MKLRKIDVIILLALALLCIASATWGVFKNINIDLSDADSVTGQVVHARATKIREATFKLKKYKTVFVLKLENSNQQFAIDRGADFSNYLKTQIKTGDTVKVHYRPGTSEYNSFVFQIEKNKNIVAGFNEYKKQETDMIILTYVFGVIILAGLTFWFVKKKKQPRLT